MKTSLSPWMKFGPAVFYLLEVPFWLFFAFPQLAGADIRKPVGFLGLTTTCLYGPFIFASLLTHGFFVVTQRNLPAKLLLLANVLGIIGYALLTISVLMWGLYR